MLTETELRREAAASGFRPEILEKAIRLIDLLELLRSHPFLRDRIALKGGTAVNLFLFDVPRLSVDVDLNYLGDPERDTMLAERPDIGRAVAAVCGRLGIQVRRIPVEHAGGKWRLSYTDVLGAGTLELDMNFMLRTPLWPCSFLDSRPVGTFRATKVPVLDIHELAAGKMAALFARGASRDLFDVREILQRGGLDRRRLRLGFVVYGGINRRDWRAVSLDDVTADPRDVDRQLIPMLRSDIAPRRADLPDWTRRLIHECRDLLSSVLPFEASELKFLSRLNDGGEIAPDLLTQDPREQEIIGSHPALRWKALNVGQHRGTGDAGPHEAGSVPT